MSHELDPRWEWMEIATFGGPTYWVKGQCNHLEVVAVTAVDGERVASLCLTCDEQLPAEWETADA